MRTFAGVQSAKADFVPFQPPVSTGGTRIGVPVSDYSPQDRSFLASRSTVVDLPTLIAPYCQRKIRSATANETTAQAARIPTSPAQAAKGSPSL